MSRSANEIGMDPNRSAGCTSNRSVQDARTGDFLIAVSLAGVHLPAQRTRQSQHPGELRTTELGRNEPFAAVPLNEPQGVESCRSGFGPGGAAIGLTRLKGKIANFHRVSRGPLRNRHARCGDTEIHVFSERSRPGQQVGRAKARGNRLCRHGWLQSANWIGRRATAEGSPNNVIDPAIEEHGGRIVQTGGDSS